MAVGDTKFSDFDPAVTTVGGEQFVGLQGGDNARFGIDITKEILGIPKIIRIIVSQAAGGDPTATVIENTVGAIAYARSVAGTYSINSSSLFTNLKTFVTPKWSTLRQGSSYASVLVSLANSSQISVTSYLDGVAADDLLVGFPIEILVYP